MSWRVFINLVALAVVFFAATSTLPPLRTADTPIRTHVEPYYIANAVAQTATPNIVSAILADYRSFDTFGETTVVFTAGLACYLLLGRRRDEEAAGEEAAEEKAGGAEAAVGEAAAEEGREA